MAINGPALHDFSLDASSTCTSGMTLPAGATCAARLNFHPTAAGQRNARIVAFANGADGGVVADVALQGLGSAPPAGVLHVQPEVVAFDGRPGEQTAVITNVGSGILRVSAIGIQSPAFVLSRPPDGACPTEAFDLMPGSHCLLTVAWAGSAAASLGGNLVFSIDGAASHALPLLVTEDPALATNAGAGGGSFGMAWLVLLMLACCALALTQPKCSHA